jgi:predicted DNA binding CopG/RHH family protein
MSSEITMTKHEKVPGTDEAWESGALGASEQHIRRVEDLTVESAIDEALELQMISIRLQKSLIEDLKAIASIRGLGYQPLMKQILSRFVECEKKVILREFEIQERERREKAAQAEAKRRAA